MNAKKTLVLAAILMAALAYVWRVQLPSDERADAQQYVLGQVPPQQLTSLTLSTKDSTVSFMNSSPATSDKKNQSRESEVSPDQVKQWHLKEFEDADVDVAVLSPVLNGLRTLKIGKPLPSADLSDDLGVYGLKDPELRITVEAPGFSRQIEFGKLGSYLQQRYLRIAGEPHLYMVAEGLFSAASKQRDEFRSHSPVQFSDADLKTLKLTNAEGSVTFEPRSDGSWKIVGPAPYSADTATVSALARNLRNLKADRFASDTANFDWGKAPVTVALEFIPSASRPAITVSFLKPTTGTKSFFSLSNQKTIFEADKDLLTQFNGALKSFRKKQFFAFYADDAYEVHVAEAGKEELALTKEKATSTWRVGDKNGDTPFVQQWLTDVAALPASDYPTETRDYGFGNPTLKLSVKLSSVTEEGAKPVLSEQVLVVGSQVSTPGSGYFAATGDLSEPFIVSDIDFKKILPRRESLLPVPSPSVAPVATQAR